MRHCQSLGKRLSSEWCYECFGRVSTPPRRRHRRPCQHTGGPARVHHNSRAAPARRGAAPGHYTTNSTTSGWTPRRASHPDPYPGCAAWAASPQRFTNTTDPKILQLPDAAWINPAVVEAGVKKKPHRSDLGVGQADVVLVKLFEVVVRSLPNCSRICNGWATIVRCRTGHRS
jgi:hypothetical protein